MFNPVVSLNRRPVFGPAWWPAQMGTSPNGDLLNNHRSSYTKQTAMETSFFKLPKSPTCRCSVQLNLSRPLEKFQTISAMVRYRSAASLVTRSDWCCAYAVLIKWPYPTWYLLWNQNMLLENNGRVRFTFSNDVYIHVCIHTSIHLSIHPYIHPSRDNYIHIWYMHT